MTRIRVHIIEDDASVIDGLVTLVRTSGGEVHAWNTAECFLSRAELRDGDHVLVDIDLPGMWGDALCRKLDEHPARTRLIAMSGLPHSVLKPILVNLRASTFLRKPLVMADLEAALATF